MEDVARRFKVISYNIMLLGQVPFFGLRQEDRAEWIIPAILRDQPDVDAITFQESFDPLAHEKLVAKCNEQGFIHHSRRPFPGTPDNGGVWIASRWPMEAISTKAFGICNLGAPTADCLANKGVSYGRIFKMGRRYHTFTTHTQASDSSTGRGRPAGSVFDHEELGSGVRLPRDNRSSHFHWRHERRHGECF